MRDWGLSLYGPSLLGQAQFNYMWDDMLTRHWENAVKRSSKGYPITDIYQTDDGATVIEMALAGFEKERLSVTTHSSKNTITIASDGIETDNEQKDCRQLARRAFTRTFVDTSKNLDFENATAKFENGLLTITVHPKQEPEPKKISVL